MTDEDDIYEVEEAPPAEAPGARAWSVASSVIGAALCVVLVVAVGYWLVDVGEREAGELPVFRAALHPAKERPEDPGGAETPYQGIRSYDVAVNGGTGATGQSHLAPAPERPSGEDVAMGELAAAQTRGTGEPAATANMLEAIAPEAAAEAAAEAPAEAAPATAEDADASATEPASAGTAPAPSPPDDPDQPAASQQEVDQAAQLAARAALSPVQIQLGAYTDRDFTEDEWRRIAEANADLLAGRALAIQSTESGGKKFYRLRVGPFGDRAEATRVCEALKARGQDCLVATNG